MINDWFGYEPGDVLAKTPPDHPYLWISEGLIFVRLDQARRAENFGWRITDNSKPELGGLVIIKRGEKS